MSSEWNGVFKGQPPRVECLQVICVEHVIGAGVEGDPVRQVRDYYGQDGAHIFRVDPWKALREKANG